MFENLLATELYKHTASQNETPDNPSIYLEDESQRIGLVNIPIKIWKQMRESPLLFLQIPFEERLQYIVQHYGKADKEKLVNAIMRIKKRLGGLETKTAINHLLEDDVKAAFAILLFYYDKQYNKGLQSRTGSAFKFAELTFENADKGAIAEQILNVNLLSP